MFYLAPDIVEAIVEDSQAVAARYSLRLGRSAHRIWACSLSPPSESATCRGVVRKRLKLTLSSKKVDGNRVYQIAGTEMLERQEGSMLA